MATDDYTQLHGVILKITRRAVLLRSDEDRREVWIPQSVIFEDDLAEMEEGDSMEINVKTWFCAKENLP